MATTSQGPGRETLKGAGARKGRLNRTMVLEAALALIDSGGLDGFTMRGLGQALGRDPMAPYRYAANRSELLDGVTEIVLDRVHVDAADPDWQGQLRHIAHSLRLLALAHPNTVPLLVSRPLSVPLSLRPLGTIRPLERILDLLITAGFEPTSALHIYRAYYGFLYGHILNELQEYVVDPDEHEMVLRLGLHRLPPKEFPRLRALAAELSNYDGEAELNQGLDILLTGLAARLAPLPN